MSFSLQHQWKTTFGKITSKTISLILKNYDINRAIITVDCELGTAQPQLVVSLYYNFVFTQFKDHTMKNDYEAVAFARAEAKGPKDVAHYHKKLAKDIKMAKKGNKQ
jgi:hypothetical protein